MSLTFVSYSGGNLVLAIDGVPVGFPRNCLSVTCDEDRDGDDDWSDIIDWGYWDIVDWPKGFPEKLKGWAVDLVNVNVDQ